MALARAAGNRVVVVTATRGERGTAHPDRWPPDRLGRLRSDELAASLAVLGVAEHRWLDYPDGCCDDAAQEAPMERVRRVLDDVRPDTIVTFGPDGVTGEPDHRAVSAWTTAAWEAVGRGPALLYATRAADPGVLRLRLDDALLDRKVAALRAHSSQVAGLPRNPPASAWWREETFLDATAPAPANAAPTPPWRCNDHRLT
jgi:LmbE family N-acetylglucosaminyl deacetylase